MGKRFAVDQNAAQAFPSAVGADVEVTEKPPAVFLVVCGVFIILKKNYPKRS